jgi:hypothetical protein
MVAIRDSRSGRWLKLVPLRASGERVLKIWRDKERRPDTIKERADLHQRRSDGKGSKA